MSDPRPPGPLRRASPCCPRRRVGKSDRPAPRPATFHERLRKRDRPRQRSCSRPMSRPIPSSPADRSVRVRRAPGQPAGPSAQLPLGREPCRSRSRYPSYPTARHRCHPVPAAPVLSLVPGDGHEWPPQRRTRQAICRRAPFLALADAVATEADEAPAGLLALAADPRLGPGFAARFNEPARAWSLPKLARLCNMSRATLARHFQEKLGRSASDLLTDIRMALAANELKKPSMSTGAVADAVGYQSEAAFQRGFKRHMGITPAQWRKTQQMSSADLFPMRRSSKANR